jgi:8-oxo-dGTP diphosphatase
MQRAKPEHIKKYVLGFIFNHKYNDRYVLLIHKNDGWQKGLVNGIGGHIEHKETAYDAMVRECQEEAGLDITVWNQFAILRGTYFDMHCFVAYDDRVLTTHVDSVEGYIHPVAYPVPDVIPIIPNLTYLLPMALNHELWRRGAVAETSLLEIYEHEHYPHTGSN